MNDEKEKTVTKPKKAKLHKRIKKDYKEASTLEIWQGTRDNFIFGFLGATLIVFISTRVDIAVLLAYIAHYFFMGRIVNRPKYITELGQLIIFPLPSAIGAFTGYKISEMLIEFIKSHV